MTEDRPPADRVFHQIQKRNTKSQKEIYIMNGTVLQAILWIVAGFFLTVLIIRRGKRKASRS